MIRSTTLSYLLFTIILLSCNSLLSQQPALVFPSAHANPFNLVEYSHEGSLLATADRLDGQIKIWDVGSGKLLRNLVAHSGKITSLRYSENDSLLISSSMDGSWCMWEVISGRLLTRQKMVDGPLYAAVVSPALDFVVSFDGDTLSVFSLAAGKTISETSVGLDHLTYRSDFNATIQITPGFSFVCVSHNEASQVFRWQKLQLKPAYDIAAANPVITPDGSTIIAAPVNKAAGHLLFSDIQTGKVMADLPLHEAAITRLELSPDKKRIVTSSNDGTARIVDIAGRKVISELRMHHGRPDQVAVSINDSLFAAFTNNDQYVYLWNGSGSQLTDSIVAPTDGVSKLAFLGPQWLLVVSSSGIAKVFDLRRRVAVYEMKEKWSGYGNDVQLSPDGEVFAFRDADQQLVISKVSTGQKIAASSAYGPFFFMADGEGIEFKHPSESVYWAYKTNQSFTFQPLVGFHTQKKLALAVDSSRVHFIAIAEIESKKILQRIPLGKGFRNAARMMVLSYDDRYLAVVTRNTLRVIDVVTGLTVQKWSGAFYIQSVQFSKAFNTIIVSGGKNVILWNFKTNEILSQLEEQYLSVQNFFSRSGRTFTFGKQVFDAQTGKEIFFVRSLHARKDIGSAAFATDSTIVTVARNYSPAFFFWNSSSAKLVAAEKFSNDFQPKLISGRRGKTFAVTTENGRTLRIIDGAHHVALSTVKGVNALTSTIAYNPLTKQFLWHNRRDRFARLFDPSISDNSVIFSPGGEISQASYSPDGKRIMISGNTYVRTYDAQKGKLLTTVSPNENTGGIYSRTTSDSKIIIVGYSADSLVYVHNTVTGNKWKAQAFQSGFSINSGPVITVSPDDKSFLTADYQFHNKCVVIRKFDMGTGNELFARKYGFDLGIKACNISPDTKTFWTASGASELEVCRFNFDNGDLEDSIHLPTRFNFSGSGRTPSIELPDNQRAIIKTETSVHLMSVILGKLVESRLKYPEPFETKAIAYNQPYGLIACTSADWRDEGIFIFDTAGNYQYHIDSPLFTEFYFTAGGRFLLVTTNGGSHVHLYESPTGKHASALKLRDTVYGEAAVFSENGASMLVRQDDQRLLQVYAVRSAKLIRELTFEQLGISRLADLKDLFFFDKKGEYLFYAGGKANQPALYKFSLTGGRDRDVASPGLQWLKNGYRYYIYDPEIKQVGMYDMNTLSSIGAIRTDSLLTHIRISPDGQKLLGISNQNIMIWDAGSRKLAGIIRNGYRTHNVIPGFSEDSRFIFTGDSCVEVYDATTATKLFTLENSGNLGYPYVRSFYPYILYPGSMDNVFRIWNASSGKLVVREKIAQNVPNYNYTFLDSSHQHLVLQKDAGTVLRISLGEKNKTERMVVNDTFLLNLNSAFRIKDKLIVPLLLRAKILEVSAGKENGALVLEAPRQYLATVSAALPAKNRYSYSNGGYSVNLLKGRDSVCLRNPSGPVEALRLSEDGNHLYTFSGTTLTAFDVTTGKVRMSFSDVRYLEGQFMGEVNGHLMVQVDEGLKIFDYRTGKLSCFFSSFDSGYFTGVDSGYYMVNRLSAGKLYYVKHLKIISFSQGDLTYNRPDIVLQRLARIFGHKDTSRIRKYRTLYQKRVEQMAKRSIKQHNPKQERPLIRVINEKLIRTLQVSDSVALRLSSSAQCPLAVLNIWVNGCPVLNRKNERMTLRRSPVLDTAVTIKLTEGSNVIEYSVTDTDGIESDRHMLSVHCLAKSKKPQKVYFFGIGVDNYEKMGDLTYSTKDIRDIAELFEDMGAEIDTLMDAEATLDNVKKVFNKLSGAYEEDMVVIAYSGHGTVEKADYYLGTTRMSVENPSEYGLPYIEMEKAIEKIKARRKMLLIDACHSGEVDEEELKRYRAVSDSLRRAGITFNLAELAKDTSYGLQNTFDLMQQTFLDVGLSTGCNIITAASGLEMAQARGGEISNSVFTSAILHAREEFNTMSVNELKEYVQQYVQTVTRGLQRPSSRNSETYFDWKVW